jgi:hypothetical protein
VTWAVQDTGEEPEAPFPIPQPVDFLVSIHKKCASLTLDHFRRMWENGATTGEKRVTAYFAKDTVRPHTTSVLVHADI